ncbi:hypothetical protein HZA57_07295 [Candidatus Poribacteria bacterium]|nr:hypothetical protein [Candidatus Poribacteria bacterium]
MASRIPEMHRRLLDERVAGVKPGDLEFVRKHYDAMKDSFDAGGVRLIQALFRQLAALRALLDHPGDLTARQRDVAIAAMKYFLSEDDHISDGHHSVAGLVDDALVVEAAVEELGGLIKF